MATAARAIAGGSGQLKATIFGPSDLKRMKMGALLGVGRGSAQPPRLIMVDYKPKGRVRKTICIVGKGITFDTGGISLKPAESMEKMKYDMSGGATVLGAMNALGRLKPAGVRVIGLVAAAENMPGGRALKPGDVLTASNGMTIEVNNTDAEGRLVLSDALSYAHRFKPDAVIDLATLTGAVVIALGSQCAGALGNDQDLVDAVIASGKRTGERLWQLPTWPEYNDLLKSDIADMKNSGGREAGTIAGAMFLAQFAAGYPWVHLDIAGVAWNDRDKPYGPRGAVGFGVRLLIDYLEHAAAAR
jgi:leucyl aminopeptidase